MTFEKKWLEFDNSDSKERLSFSIWLSADERKELFEAGTRIRQSKVSTILKQLFKIGLAKLRKEEEMSEILLDNERRNKRTGLEELELLQNELRRNLEK